MDCRHSKQKLANYRLLHCPWSHNWQLLQPFHIECRLLRSSWSHNKIAISTFFLSTQDLTTWSSLIDQANPFFFSLLLKKSVFNWWLQYFWWLMISLKKLSIARELRNDSIFGSGSLGYFQCIALIAFALYLLFSKTEYILCICINLGVTTNLSN